MKTKIARYFMTCGIKARYIAPVVAWLFFTLQLLLERSGALSPDSEDQLQQALTGKFSDWHPPAMAYFWRMLILATNATSSIFIFQTACYWLGFGLLSHAMLRTARIKTGLALLVIGLFPFFLYINNIVTKDSQMGCALLASTALIFWFKSQSRDVPLPIAILAGIILAYGTLVRANAAFAIGPILIYFFEGRHRTTLFKVMVGSLLATVLAILLATLINNSIPGISHKKPIRSLQTFDIIGVAKYSGDRQIAAEIFPVTAVDVAKCYTPYWWDSFSTLGPCASFARAVFRENYAQYTNEENAAWASKLNKVWLASIARHPLAYAEHRLKHFNAELSFIVPALVRRYQKMGFQATPSDIQKDYIRKSVVTWPITWFFIAIITLTSLRRSTYSPINQFSILLSASGLMYGFAYLVIGVASDSRYMYWTVLSSFIGLALAAPEIKRNIMARDRVVTLVCALFFASILAGFLARVGDWSFMLS